MPLVSEIKNKDLKIVTNIIKCMCVGFFFFNKPEEDQLLLVLVLPQKRHQAVELVFSSADLKRRRKIVSLLHYQHWEQCEADQTHCVVVGESGGRLLDGGGSHAFLFDSDADWVPEAGPHQLLQLLRLRG